MIDVKLPSFHEFLDKTGGMIFSGVSLDREDPLVPFSEEQGEFLVDAIGAMVVTALEHYHEWLSENLDS